MYERTISDIVIIGAGSAGLSCAYHLASTRPDVSNLSHLISLTHFWSLPM